jgi:hypothetical protein
MARAVDAGENPDEDETLPDEREAIAERLDSLADDARRSLAAVTETLESDE